MGLGDILKSERERQGLSLETIEEETKIRKLYLQAIENEQFSSLPPRVYSVGFVKRYAKFLGLNEIELAKEFQYLAYGKEEVQEEIVLPHEPKKSLPLKNIAAAAIFLLVAIWVGNYLVGFFSENINDQTPAQPPTAQQPAEEPQQEPDAEKEEQPPATASGTVDLLLQAKEDCWVSASVNGQIVYAQTLPAGQEKAFKENSTIYLTLGNAGGVDVTYNGKKLDPFGKHAEAVKNLEFKVAE